MRILILGCVRGSSASGGGEAAAADNRKALVRDGGGAGGGAAGRPPGAVPWLRQHRHQGDSLLHHPVLLVGGLQGQTGQGQGPATTRAGTRLPLRSTGRLDFFFVTANFRGVQLFFY